MSEKYEGFLKIKRSAPWEEDGESGAFPGSRSDHDIAPLQGDDLPGQVESDPDPGDMMYLLFPMVM